MTHAEYVGVDSHGRLAEGYRLDDVGCLATYAGQVQQLVHVGRNLAMVTFHQHACHLHQMLCLSIRIRHTLDILQHLVDLCLGHRLGVRILAEQFRCHLIDALVRTLCAEHHGYQQLEDAAKLQFCISLRHLLAEVAENSFVSLFLRHRNFFRFLFLI